MQIGETKMKPSEERKLNLNWGYVYKANKQEKSEMAECVEDLNVSDFWNDSERPIHRYELGRGYTVVAKYPDGNEERGSFIRCQCGQVQDYWEGQIPSCWKCGIEWNGI